MREKEGIIRIYKKNYEIFYEADFLTYKINSSV